MADGVVVVALPAADHPINEASSEDQAHITLAYLGTVDDYVDTDGELDIIGMLADELGSVAALLPAMTETPSGQGSLGAQGAQVIFMDGNAAVPLRDAVLAQPTLGKLEQLARTHPAFMPHLTMGYPDTPPNGEHDMTPIPIDRLALWAGDDRREFALGGADAPLPPEDEVAVAEAPVDDLDPEDDDDPEMFEPIPWHGILTIEGRPSDDRRIFEIESLRMRELPLPIRYVKSDNGAHLTAVIVGRIDRIERDELGNIWGYGVFNDTPEADEAIGLLADRSLRGVSLDAADIYVELRDENGNPPDMNDPELDTQKLYEVYTSAKVTAATLVAIPAFEEAYVALGESPDAMSGPKTGDVPLDTGDAEAVDAEFAAIVASIVEEFAQFAPGTHDGPGWITNPRATRRIRNYWTKGPGAAKIGWGAPNDFYRCRSQLRKYVKNPDWLNGLCANMHKEVLGVWPGQEAASAAVDCTDCDRSPGLSLVADAGRWIPADDMFANPGLTEPTPLTIVDHPSGDKHVFGHLATWGTCHIGFGQKACVEPPRSETGYAHYMVGHVETTEGLRAVGQLTIDTGHADIRASGRAAAAHYDHTGAAVADVTVGEDEIGIWFSGCVRPWITPAQFHTLRATGLSGDWRSFGNGLELVGALGVNVGGFNIPRPVALSASADGTQGYLIAANMLMPKPEVLAALADQVAAIIESRQARREIDTLAAAGGWGAPSETEICEDDPRALIDAMTFD